MFFEKNKHESVHEAGQGHGKGSELEAEVDQGTTGLPPVLLGEQEVESVIIIASPIRPVSSQLLDQGVAETRQAMELVGHGKSLKSFGGRVLND